jgi:hypothetical protein
MDKKMGVSLASLGSALGRCAAGPGSIALQRDLQSGLTQK